MRLECTYDHFDVGLILRQFQTKTLGQRDQRALTGSVCWGNGPIGGERPFQADYVVDVNDAAVVQS